MTKRFQIFLIAALGGFALLLTTGKFPVSCEKEVAMGGLPRIERIRPIDPGQKDSSINSASLGQVIVVVGENLLSTRSIEVNGYTNFFSPTMVTDNHLIFTIDEKTPTIATDPGVTNRLVLFSDEGNVSFPLKILPPPPKVESVSKTSARAGEQITFHGSNFFFVTEIEFPGGVNSTSMQVNANGKTLNVLVPEGVYHTGKIIIKTESGWCNPETIFSFRPGS
jgi:hypothetical protein